MILTNIQILGHRGLQFLQDAGHALLLLSHAILGKIDLTNGFSRLVKQLYFVGVLSLIIIILSGLFIGMVLGLQGHTILVKFGAEYALGELIALSLVRELGPVVSALLFAGRACSALAA